MGDQVDPKVLRDLLDYDPETGALTWLPRTADMFESGAHSAEWRCRKWNGKNAGRVALDADVLGYRHGSIFGVCYRAHRVIWAWVHGRWPSDQIDHINGDKADNRLVNLREVTRQENGRNAKRSKSNSSGATGVHYYRATGRWSAKIHRNGRAEHLGYFPTMEAAAVARKSAEIALGFHPNHGRAI